MGQAHNWYNSLAVLRCSPAKWRVHDQTASSNAVTRLIIGIRLHLVPSRHSMTNPPDMDSRPAKRARTEDEPEPVVRCEELWYDDGNLVLQAERTQFRVHRSILCKQSIVFKDMKEASCTSTGSTTVEGCPVVELQDSAEAVKYMLRCIYDACVAAFSR